jgi:hypothetical protein
MLLDIKHLTGLDCPRFADNPLFMIAKTAQKTLKQP